MKSIKVFSSTTTRYFLLVTLPIIAVALGLLLITFFGDLSYVIDRYIFDEVYYVSVNDENFQTLKEKANDKYKIVTDEDSEISPELEDFILANLEQERLFISQYFSNPPSFPVSIYVTNDIEVYEMFSNRDYDFELGISGLTRGNNMTLLVSKFESHRHRERLRNIMMHEYVHVLQASNESFFQPIWFQEGTAEYISKYDNREVFTADSISNYDSISDLEDNIQNSNTLEVFDAYGTSAYIVKQIEKDFGRDALIRLINFRNNVISFDSYFEEVTGTTLEKYFEELKSI